MSVRKGNIGPRLRLTSGGNAEFAVGKRVRAIARLLNDAPLDGWVEDVLRLLHDAKFGDARGYAPHKIDRLSVAEAQVLKAIRVSHRDPRKSPAEHLDHPRLLVRGIEEFVASAVNCNEERAAPVGTGVGGDGDEGPPFQLFAVGV